MNILAVEIVEITKQKMLDQKRWTYAPKNEAGTALESFAFLQSIIFNTQLISG